MRFFKRLAVVLATVLWIFLMTPAIILLVGVGWVLTGKDYMEPYMDLPFIMTEWAAK